MKQIVLFATWIQPYIYKAKTGGSISHRGNSVFYVGRFSVKPGGEFDAVCELDSVVVGTIGEEGNRTRAPVYLKDLGLNIVRDYEDPPSAIARYGNAHTSEPCVIPAFTMKSEENITELCATVRDRISRLKEKEKIVPPDIGIAYISDQSETVTRKLDDFVLNVVEAVIIVIVVVYLMVGIRSAAVMAANIPIVILSPLAVITLFDVQLEQVSLASMIISLGLLVDNAVEVCDQTRSLQIKGETSYNAAVKGSSEVSVPVLFGTLTTISAFLPMLFGLQGSSREYIYSLPVTLSVTLGLSYILAMTFASMLSCWFIKPPKGPVGSDSPLLQLYGLIKVLVTGGGRKASTAADPAHGPNIGGIYPGIARLCSGFRPNSPPATG